jgi:hypothetical protein
LASRELTWLLQKLLAESPDILDRAFGVHVAPSGPPAARLEHKPVNGA